MSDLRAVIFDLDGTLVDSERLVMRAINELLAEAGMAMPTFCEQMVRGKLLIERARILQECAGLPVDPALFAERLGDRYDAIWKTEGLPILPGAERLMADIRDAHLPMALTSNGGREYVDAVLRLCGWETSFQAVIAYDDVGVPKPDARMYREALGRLHVSADEAIAIEDSLAGMESAHAAGVRVIAATDTSVPPWVAKQVKSLEELNVEDLKKDKFHVKGLLQNARRGAWRVSGRDQKGV